MTEKKDGYSVVLQCFVPFFVCWLDDIYSHCNVTSRVVLAIAAYATLYMFFSNDRGHQTAAIMKFSISNASFSGYFQWRNILAFLFFGFRSFQTSENLHQHYNVPVACQGIGMDDNLREVQHVQETVGIPKDGQLPAGFDRAKSSDSWMGVVGEDLVKGVFKTICVVFGLELFIK